MTSVRLRDALTNVDVRSNQDYFQQSSCLRSIKLRTPQTACFQNTVLRYSAQCNYTMMDSTTLIMEPPWRCYQLTRVDLSSQLNKRRTNSLHTLINQRALTPTCGSTNRLGCQVGFKFQRPPRRRATNTNFFFFRIV